MEDRGGRVTSIDAVRGLVMVIMAIDHVRDFVHAGAMAFSPTDLSRTSTILFLTRWVTHLCAPTFLFTAGVGAWFWWQRSGSRSALARFLVTRGLWLVLLELTIMRLAYNFTFSPAYPVLLLVLWVLGLSMILVASAVWLPNWALMTAALATMGFHNLLDPIRAADLGGAAWLWTVVHQVGVFTAGGATVLVGYPAVPWVAVMAFGLACGSIFTRPPAERQRVLAVMGVAATMGFIGLRALNGYGDPVPWSPQPSGVFTALSFLNATKYPPSLAFLLMTLGPAFLIVAWFDRCRVSPANPLVVLGQAPLFYFVAHFFLAHAAVAALSFARYGGVAWTFVFHPVPSMGGPRALYPADFGWSLGVTFVVWAAVVAALYPACRLVGQWKARRRAWWVSYL